MIPKQVAPHRVLEEDMEASISPGPPLYQGSLVPEVKIHDPVEDDGLKGMGSSGREE